MGLHDRLKTSNGSGAATAELLGGNGAVQEATPESKARWG